jgi:segregation and condensation protein B
MLNDYSMAPISESDGALDWVKGNLPSGEPETLAQPPAPEAPEAPKIPAPPKSSGESATPEAESSPAELPAALEAAPVSSVGTPSLLESAAAEAPGEGELLPPMPPSEPLSLESLVESLLFVAEGPVPVAHLAEALEVSPREVEAALARLAETYQKRGLSVQRSRDKAQLTTAAAAAERVQRFLGLAATTPLSRAALETLAIIAYQQPVTRPQIEAVRGVNSDSVIKNLLSKGIIEEVGRTDGPGRPVLYATTPEFLQYFGIASLADLPPLNLEQKPVQAMAEPSPAILKE